MVRRRGVQRTGQRTESGNGFINQQKRGFLQEMELELDSEGEGRSVGRWTVMGKMAGWREHRLESALGRFLLVVYMCNILLQNGGA